MRLQSTQQVEEFRKLGIELQEQAVRAENAVFVPDCLSEEYAAAMWEAKSTLGNLGQIAGAAATINRFVEAKLGMSIEGLIVSMSGSKDDAVWPGIFCTMAMANVHVRLVIDRLKRLNAQLEKEQ